MPLFASLPELPTSAFVITLVSVSLLFVGFFLWLVFRQVAKSRELSHLERMKALELGKSIEPSDAETGRGKYLHNAFWICFWIGAGVPMAATSSASSIMIKTELQEFRTILAIWICVAVISVFSLVCATALMISCRQWGHRTSADKGTLV